MTNGLKRLRIILAVVFFSLINLVFLDFTGITYSWFGWIAKVQFIPALLAVNAGALIFLVLLTLVFGRVYCSVICPLGIVQDIISWIAGKKKKNRFTWSKPKNWLRYGVLALFLVSVVFGITFFVTLLDPYAAYGRIASSLLAPLYQWGNNLLAYFSQRYNNYTFYSIDVWLKSVVTLITAILTLIIIGYLSWKHGRTYCNTICPVGTILGFISRYSLFKPVIDSHTCNGCKACTRNCKAACIDADSHKIDYSRCVVCMDCLEKCNQDAIHYKFTPFYNKKQDKQVVLEPLKTPQSKSTDKARRNFLTLTGIFAVTGILKSQSDIGEGGLAVIEDKIIPERANPVFPPGSISQTNFNSHCTACGLCVTACTNDVLRPSGKVSSFLQPEMSYERGYCRPECTSCSDVCPTGAILPITSAEKTAIQIGYAVWIRDNCVVLTDDVNCDNCATHCPTGAITMVSSNADDPDARKIPAIETERCNGCGACEHLCPARPFSAIYIEGTEKHIAV